MGVDRGGGSEEGGGVPAIQHCDMALGVGKKYMTPSAKSGKTQEGLNNIFFSVRAQFRNPPLRLAANCMRLASQPWLVRAVWPTKGSRCPGLVLCGA